MKFAIVGAGKVGTILATVLSRAGYEFLGAASRSHVSAVWACESAGSGTPTTDPAAVCARADLILITTPDGAVGAVCAELAASGGIARGATVAHVSGALSSDVLAGARQAGAAVGSLHPLQTFPDVPRGIEALPGAYCCIEGDPGAAGVLEDVACAVGLHPFTIPSAQKALYHAAAVLACNCLVALQSVALDTAETAGVPAETAREAFLPLVRATVENVGALGPAAALTGPIARGDTATVAAHLATLRESAPAALPVYHALSVAAIDVAHRQGTLSDEQADELRTLLDR